MNGAPFVVLSSVNPVAPVWLVNVAEVVLKPAGVVQLPPAVLQYKNLIEPTVPVVGMLKARLCLTTPAGFEPPSLAPASRVRLRDVRVAAVTPLVGNNDR